VGVRERERREERWRERAAILCDKGVMILGFLRIGDSWIGKRIPAELRADAGQTTTAVAG
jgi:hypothetical protein